MRFLFAFVACFIQSTLGYYDLKQLSYTQLATGTRSGAYLYGGLNAGAATDAAYDFTNYIMYVIGKTSHFMHVIDILDPANPTLLFVHEFTKGQGVPRSVDVCGDDVGVALSAQTDVNEGHVRLYKTYKRGSGATALALDGYITVGNYPKSLKFTKDCGSIVIANEGIAGKDEAGAYVNPEGSISIIHGEKTGNPSVRLVDFLDFNMGATNYNAQIRCPSLNIPSGTLSPMTTVSQDIEPEDVTISNDGRTAWVTLQENNAIAEINIINGVVNKVIPLPTKSWLASGIDCSDRDGGVHRRMYAGLMSLRQPGVIKSFEIGNKKFLFTGDEGAPKIYTSAKHGFAWSDLTTGYNLRSQIDASQPDLAANASNNEYLGRLQVSSIDGKSAFGDRKFLHLEAFGGRGYSIWDTANPSSPEFDSDGTLEQYMEAFDKNVFNTDYVSNLYYESPEQLRDASSYKQGAQLTGLDIKDDNGTVFLAVGTWSTGTLFLYTVDTSSGQPIPMYQTIVRSGSTDIPWGDLYSSKSAGDLYISDLGIITSEHSPTDSPLLYVVSTGGGALSLYSIEQTTGGIPGA